MKWETLETFRLACKLTARWQSLWDSSSEYPNLSLQRYFSKTIIGEVTQSAMIVKRGLWLLYYVWVIELYETLWYVYVIIVLMLYICLWVYECMSKLGIMY